MSAPASPNPTPAPKRRKTSSALLKPFKSPFKTSPNPSAAPTQSDDTSPQTTNADTTVSATPDSPPRDSNTIITTTPLRRPPTKPTSPPNKSSPELTALQRQHTSLLQTLRTVTSTLDTATQALKIESSTRDAELTRLIEVWKAASRQAAEEIFAGVRDRVNRMGGVGAWRERERERKMAWGGGWEDDGAKGNSKGDGSGEYGDEGVEDEGAEEGREREGAEQEREREVEADVDGREEEGFTMDMMLHALSIDLDVIGYDKEMQRWID